MVYDVCANTANNKMSAEIISAKILYVTCWIKKLVVDLKEHELFQRWMKNDDVGDPPVPIELRLLGFLRYVGHGFTMDDLEEATAVSGETQRQFTLKNWNMDLLISGTFMLWKL